MIIDIINLQIHHLATKKNKTHSIPYRGCAVNLFHILVQETTPKINTKEKQKTKCKLTFFFVHDDWLFDK